MKFNFGSFNDGEIKFARTNYNGFTVEFQGWNSTTQPYDKVIVAKDNETLFVGRNICLDSVSEENVKHYVSEALKQG